MFLTLDGSLQCIMEMINTNGQKLQNTNSVIHKLHHWRHHILIYKN